MINYRALFDALNALPQGKRRLARNVAWDDANDCGCFWGTLIPRAEHPREGLSFTTVVLVSPTLRGYEGTNFLEVNRLERANDIFLGTEEERFEHMRRVVAKKWVERLKGPEYWVEDKTT